MHCTVYVFACNFVAETDDQGSSHSASVELKTKLDQQYYKSLDGFLIVIARNGDIVYVSENIEKYLGLTQVCLDALCAHFLLLLVFVLMSVVAKLLLPLFARYFGLCYSGIKPGKGVRYLLRQMGPW